MLRLFTSIFTKTQSEDGQTMAEYAVVLAVITVIILAALTFLAGGIGSALSKVGNVLNV